MLSQQFEIENHQKETKNRLSGIVVSALIHTVLLLCLYFIIIHTPDPPYVDNQGGMTVNYGTSDVGTGDQQQFTTVPVTVQQDAQPQASQSSPSTAQEDMETQDKEDAAVIEAKKDKVKPKVKPDPNALFTPKPKTAANPTPEPVKPKVDKNALFSPGAIGKPNKSRGDGQGGGPGDQGKPDGDPFSKNYVGDGNGNGPGKGGNGLGDGNVRLAGRKLRSRSVPKNPCETSRGRVVITISVNRDGRVTDTKFSMSGSNTSDDCLVATARQAAMKYTFDANPGAAETQTGSIVFIFKED